MSFQNRSIATLAGVQPTTDFTAQSTPHFVFSDKIRFVDGFHVPPAVVLDMPKIWQELYKACQVSLIQLY